MAKNLIGQFETNGDTGGKHPPLVEDELNAVVAEFTSAHRLPACIPQPHEAIASWWMNMQEPASHMERPHRAAVVNGEWRWICPYHNRIVATLRKFLFISDSDQRFILAAREENIFWRGDKIDFFAIVVEETKRMRKIGVSAYRSESLRKMKRFVGKIDDEANEERKAIQEEGNG